jgi:thiol:disulfide interchange protein
VRVPVTVAASAAPGPVTLSGRVSFQACDDTACFPPERDSFAAEVNVVAGPASQPATAPATQPAMLAPPGMAPTGMAPTGMAPTGMAPPGPTASASVTVAAPPRIFGRSLTGNAYTLAFAAAFVVGIIFNAMPCVLPVVPLKIMGFYEVSKHDRRKSVGLGAVFSAGIIFSFAVLALLIVVLHVIDWGGLFKQTWFTVAIVVVLAAMAAQTFGFFEVALPVGVYSWTPRHDTVTGNFLFGILTAALSTPCTFGIFATLLVWALSQPAWVGSSLLITVGVGMAFPYFVLSGFPEVARNFPRAGPWSAIVKQLMGFLLLGTAIYFAQPLMPRFVSTDVLWWLLFAVVAAAAVFLVIRALMVAQSNRAVAVAVALAALMLGPSLLAARRLTAHPYQWRAYTPAVLADATASHRPVLIDFTAAWCGNCHFIEGTVLHNPAVVRAVRDDGVIMLQADVTGDDSIGQPLLDKLDSSHAIPLTAVYPAGGGSPIILSGIYSVNDLIDTFNRAR